MATDKYILDADGNALAEPNLRKWGQWIENADRRVAFDKIGPASVSTVFLSLDHSFGDGPPVLWETMIFGGAHDQYQERYSTREEALAGHAKAVKMVRNA